MGREEFLRRRREVPKTFLESLSSPHASRARTLEGPPATQPYGTGSDRWSEVLGLDGGPRPAVEGGSRPEPFGLECIRPALVSSDYVHDRQRYQGGGLGSGLRQRDPLGSERNEPLPEGSGEVGAETAEGQR